MKKAFTLIELLIVVAIIAILAAIAIPNFLHAQIRAKVARSVADMRSMGVAVEAFRADWGLDLLDNWDDDDAAERAKYNQPGLSHTLLTNRGSLIVFNLLTTPVPYIQTIGYDPFLLYRTAAEALGAGVSSYAADMIVNLGGTYLYADRDGHLPSLNSYDHNIGALYPTNAQALGLLPLQIGEWVVLGVGPDARPEDYANLARRGIPYDPSNGLKSRGDLTVRSSGGVNQ